MTVTKTEEKTKFYELGVTPPAIQLIDGVGLKRVKRIKAILDAEMPQLDTWRAKFSQNMDSLFKVTPFYNSTAGFYQQEFRGEWSASSVSFDLEQVVKEHKLVTVKNQDDDGK